jgi:hypothetical protein
MARGPAPQGFGGLGDLASDPSALPSISPKKIKAGKEPASPAGRGGAGNVIGARSVGGSAETGSQGSFSGCIFISVVFIIAVIALTYINRDLGMTRRSGYPSSQSPDTARTVPPPGQARTREPVRVEFEEFGVRYRIPVPGSDGPNGAEELCWCMRHMVRLDINLWYRPDAGNNPAILDMVGVFDDRCSKMFECSDNLLSEAYSRSPMAGMHIVKAALDVV